MKALREDLEDALKSTHKELVEGSTPKRGGCSQMDIFVVSLRWHLCRASFRGSS